MFERAGAGYDLWRLPDVTIVSGSKTIRRLLIANRGEIAVRVVDACRELGIHTVAIASEPDKTARHTRVADTTVLIGGTTAAESYLRGDDIIKIALETDCQAIHPGYGFLSQDADFAQSCIDAGLLYVGPPPSAMRIMGNKPAARARMQDSDVPVVPGFTGTGDESLAELKVQAEAIGFPLLVKAAAGGGGKGMRIVRSAAELEAGLEAAHNEALRSFGNGRLFLERYVENAHHIEVQVLADEHENVLHLFERECSLQRRYQKVIEESPSPLLDPALREEIAQAAVRATQACGYVSAGTVEFLVSSVDRSFYFLEMNTRLQVEHPVTEAVVGLDIVAAQIRIAQNEPLTIEQSELTQRGHAIECRVYAEDPSAGFAPSTGTLHVVRFPSGPGIRVDTGVESGDQVSIYYDPMIAKVIVHAESREAARRRMVTALNATTVIGVETNIAFLLDLLESDAFIDGTATTAFIDEERQDWSPPQTEHNPELFIAAAFADFLGGGGAESPADGGGSVDADLHSPWKRRDGFRPGGS